MFTKLSCIMHASLCPSCQSFSVQRYDGIDLLEEIIRILLSAIWTQASYFNSLFNSIKSEARLCKFSHRFHPSPFVRCIPCYDHNYRYFCIFARLNTHHWNKKAFAVAIIHLHTHLNIVFLLEGIRLICAGYLVNFCPASWIRPGEKCWVK